MDALTLSAQEDVVVNRGCLHCGSAILGLNLQENSGEKFCCSGCQCVYEILSKVDGGRYYELLGLSQGTAPKAVFSKSYQQFLKEIKSSDLIRTFGRWNKNIHTLTLESQELQCAACGWLMERLLGKCNGVLGYEVDFIRGEIVFSYDAIKTTLSTVLEKLGTFGYYYKPKISTTNPSLISRTTWMRIAVAAACFMNSMAFSAGGYFGVSQGMNDSWSRYLGSWAFISALPAVFYAAIPFYLGAFRAIRSRIFTIDVTVTLGIILAFTVASRSYVIRGTGDYSDTISGLIFFLLVGRVLVQRFENGMTLKHGWKEELSPAWVNRWNGSTWELKPLSEIVCGDCIRIAAGDYVPVDGVSENSEGQVETALLTGEQEARTFGKGDFLFAGFRVLENDLILRVTTTRKNCRIENLLEVLDALTIQKKRDNKKLERVALFFTIGVIVSALLALWIHRHTGWQFALETAASVFIVSCSCSLALATPLSRGVGLLRAHRLGFHFRDQAGLEKLALARCAIFDKTGTLTLTKRAVVGWDWGEAFHQPILQARILSGIKGLTARSLHSVSTAIHDCIPGESSRIESFIEIPHFGIFGITQELPALNLCLCRFNAWNENLAAFQELRLCNPRAWEIPKNNPNVSLFVDGRLAAGIRLNESIKPGVTELIQGLDVLQIPVLLLSGDTPDRVADFAKKCGIDHFVGGLSPEEKQRHAEIFQEQHGPAFAVGDGFNDSLVFGIASSSIAVQGSAGLVAEEADVFATNQNPKALLSLLKISAGVQASFRNAWIVSGVYNVFAISLAMAGKVSPLFAAILMPLSGLTLCATARWSVPKQ